MVTTLNVLFYNTLASHVKESCEIVNVILAQAVWRFSLN